MINTDITLTHARKKEKTMKKRKIRFYIIF